MKFRDQQKNDVSDALQRTGLSSEAVSGLLTVIEAVVNSGDKADKTVADIVRQHAPKKTEKAGI